MAVTNDQKISNDIEKLANHYQLLLDAFTVYDKDGDGKISLKKELAVDDYTAQLLDCEKPDRRITRSELGRALSHFPHIERFLEYAPRVQARWMTFILEQGMAVDPKEIDRIDIKEIDSADVKYPAKITHNYIRRDDDGYNFMRAAMPLLASLKPEDAPRLAERLFNLADGYRIACIHTKSPGALTEYGWIFDLLKSEKWFGDEEIDISIEAVDALASLLRSTDDLRDLRRDVGIMMEHDGAKTIIAHKNIKDMLEELRTKKLPKDKNFVAVYDQNTLKAEIITLPKGKFYYTKANEAVVGSHKWKGSGTEFSVPHNSKAMRLVPWLVDIGEVYLDDTIKRVIEYIEANDIRSSVFTADYVDPRPGEFMKISEIGSKIGMSLEELVKKLTYIEIMGNDFMRAGENNDWLKVANLVDTIHFRLGAYGKDAFSRTVSKDSARGMCQIIEKTYDGLNRKYGNHLTPNFIEGTKDHFNAIKTQLFMVDEIMHRFITRCDNSYAKYAPKAREKLKDPATLMQFIAISYNRGGGTAFEWLVNSKKKLTKEPENHRRKSLVVDRYFELRPLVNLAEIGLEKYAGLEEQAVEAYGTVQDVIEPHLQGIKTYMANVLPKTKPTRKR